MAYKTKNIQITTITRPHVVKKTDKKSSCAAQLEFAIKQ